MSPNRVERSRRLPFVLLFTLIWLSGVLGEVKSASGAPMLVEIYAGSDLRYPTDSSRQQLVQQRREDALHRAAVRKTQAQEPIDQLTQNREYRERKAYVDSYADLVPVTFRPLIQEVSLHYGLDPRMVASVITVESSWTVTAVGSYQEEGLMQILPSTARWLAGSMQLQHYDLFDPRQNVYMGAYYLHILYEEYGNWEQALAAYNGGPRGATKGASHPYTQRVLRVYNS